MSGGGRPAAERVLSELRPLLAAAGLGLGVADISEPCPQPAGPAEAAEAATMPARRRLEFLAGRRAARRALRAVGQDCGEIPRSGRLPVFPPGRAASISHSAGVAVAVARPPGTALPLGCDLELRPLPRAAARLVLRADEEVLLSQEEQEELPRFPARPTCTTWSVTALFSAKEAAWKALAVPGGGRRVGSVNGHRAGPVDEQQTGPLNGRRAEPGDGRRARRPYERQARPGREHPAAAPDTGRHRDGPGDRRRTVPGEQPPPWSAGSLRDLRVDPSGDALLVRLRADPAHAVRVRVVHVGAGVFSYVLGRADAHD
ncbi:enterobactin synthetase [Streptomyces sp. CA-251251]|uniref:enterobactin synthetase n=1 Tax=Streptomyces sp. CA-251251 TaxID=3240063 RepID=UPI003D94D180